VVTISLRVRPVLLVLPLGAAMALFAAPSVFAVVPPPLNCVVNTASADASATAPAASCDSTLGVGKVTLRSAIEAFNAAVSGTDGTIGFSLPSGSVITLTLGQLVVSRNTGSLTIHGPGYLGARALAVDGNAAARVFEADPGTNLTITALTIRNGKTNGNGGGVQTFGVLTLNGDTFTGNHAGYAGAIDIRNESGTPRLTMTNSTVSGNVADSEGDSAISIEGAGDISSMTNDTIANNVNNGSAEATAIEVYGSNVTLNLNSVTLAGNTFTASSVDSSFPPAALGVYNGGTANVHNSVIANNTTGIARNCATNSGSTIVDQGYNLDSANQCGFTVPNHDLVNTNAALGALANNGGPTDTMALGATSPALDAADPACPLPRTDQRGVNRPQGPRCDMGAYERVVVAQSPSPSPTATVAPALPRAGASGNSGVPEPTALGLLGFLVLTAGIGARWRRHAPR
jgi:hypothetical protein